MMTRTERIEQARRGDLLAVAQSLSIPLRREGKYWRIPGHGGLMIYRKNGVWVWCQMSEERGGDAISFLTSSPVSSMSFREAVELLTGSLWPSEDSKGFKGKKSPVPSLKPSSEPQSPKHDIELWSKKALAFCQWCHERLMSPAGAEVRRWLKERRGLHVETLRRFYIGWNPRQFFRAKRDWGFDGDGKMGLSSGLVVPKFSLDEQLVGITIRRLDKAEAKKWGKYYSVPSPFGRPIWTTQQAPGPEDSRAGGWPLLVVEGELDAILLSQETQVCNVACLGSAGRKPALQSHRDFWELFTKGGKVFLALDNDPAGERALEWWLKEWRNTRPLLVPKGKDVTEAYLQGVDLKQWLLDAFDRECIKGWPLFSLAVDTIGQKIRKE